MRRTEIVDMIRSILHKVAPNAQIILYGSEARGEARPDSDIDLLILVDEPDVYKRQIQQDCHQWYLVCRSRCRAHCISFITLRRI